MRSRYIKYLIVFPVALISFGLRAQQDPQFTHYMYNMSVVNPAYATDEQSVINLGGMYRAQWVGMEGAPKTQTFFAHKPLTEKVQAGISITHDEIGDVVDESNIYADFAYVLPVSEQSKLSFGLKAGLTLFSTDFTGFVYNDALPDPAFQKNISETFPNVGLGTYFYGANYYLGLSAPNLLKTKHLENDSGVKATGVEDVHYFLTGGYVFTINGNDNLKIKPAFMAKGVAGAPLSLDVTANALINNKFEAGVGYRFDDSISALAAFSITPDFRIGYAYDYTLTNLGNYNSGSHEVFLLYNLNLDKLGLSNKGYEKSPRFF